jgi:hypothetical protein
VTIVRVPVVTAPAAVRKSALIGLSGALGRVSVALIAGEVLRHGRIDAKLRYVRHVEQWLGGPLQRGITARTGDVVADVDQAVSDDAGERSGLSHLIFPGRREQPGEEVIIPTGAFQLSFDRPL